MISFAISGAPTFLTIQAANNAVKGVIDASATLGAFNYQVTVTDSVSGLATTLPATLYVYECMPAGFTLTPSTLTVRISGPSLASVWTLTPPHTTCGAYPVTFDPAYSYLLNLNGQQIDVQAPISAAVGTFSPAITITRANNVA